MLVSVRVRVLCCLHPMLMSSALAGRPTRVYSSVSAARPRAGAIRQSTVVYSTGAPSPVTSYYTLLS